MKNERIKYSLFRSIAIIALMWAVFALQVAFKLNTFECGVLPRTLHGLCGILLAPLIHGNLNHIFSNTLPLFFLLWSIFYFFPKKSYKILIISWIGTYFLLWLIGRPAYHIGASGLIYALSSFMVFSSLITGNISLLAISLIIIFLYGSSLWGMFPSFATKSMSWEGHFSGYIVGFILAFALTKHKKQPKTYFRPFLDFMCLADIKSDFVYLSIKKQPTGERFQPAVNLPLNKTHYAKWVKIQTQNLPAFNFEATATYSKYVFFTQPVFLPSF